MKYNNQIFLDEFKNKMLEINPQKVLFVCSNDYDRYGYRKALDEINIKSVSFTSFEPCPEVSSVENGIEAYKQMNAILLLQSAAEVRLILLRELNFIQNLILIFWQCQPRREREQRSLVFPFCIEIRTRSLSVIIQ